MNEFFHHYKEILTDPAHLAVEVTLMLLIDVLLLGMIWPLVKKAIKHEHRVIDAEHGHEHDDHLEEILGFPVLVSPKVPTEKVYVVRSDVEAQMLEDLLAEIETRGGRQ